MKLLEGSNFQRFDMLTIIVFTLLALVQGEVTVFYIIYLFWFQELLRTIIDNLFISNWSRTGAIATPTAMDRYSGFFLLFVYLVFILIVFGFMLNWGNHELIGININVFLFRNWFFNLNLILFAIEYAFYRKNLGMENLHLGAFNQNHIILHLSIILGAFIQLMVLKKLQVNDTITVLAVVAPFLIIKGIVDYRFYRKQKRTAN